MGSHTSTRRLSTESPYEREKQAQFQELYDICTNYLEHFEFIIESQQNTEDPRQLLAVLKANCQTAREQISKLPTKQSDRRRYSSMSKSSTTNSPNITAHKDHEKRHHKAQSWAV